MKIQCPECATKYRPSKPIEGTAPVQVTCPRCSCRFVVTPVPINEKKNLPTENILIVDDARFFRELLLDLLASRHAELTTADSAAEAWQKLQHSTFDLLIVDINLPDMSGLELIKNIRREQRFKNVFILCISGIYRQSDDARQALASGADDFMTKSFHPEDLNQRIDRLLGK